MLVKIRRVKGGLWSIKALNGPFAGDIVATATAVWLKEARFGSTCITGRVAGTFNLKVSRQIKKSRTEHELFGNCQEMPNLPLVAERVVDPLGWYCGSPEVGASFDVDSKTLYMVTEAVLATEVRFSPLTLDSQDPFGAAVKPPTRRPEGSNTVASNTGVIGKLKSLFVGD